MELKELVVNVWAQNKSTVLLVGGAAAALLGLGLGYKYLQKAEKVVRVGVVSQLLIHPLKSGRAVSVALAECHRIGLKFGELQDRHWLVTTEDGHMVTGRQEPRLVLVSLTCEGGRVCLNGPNMEELRFPFKQPDNAITNCRCVFTTVDPETGIITRKEPLETLKSYRQCKPSEKHIYKSAPLFGQLHTVKRTGILQVGDVVYKISR